MLEMGVEYRRDEEPVPAADAIQWVQDHVDECVAVGEIGLDHHWVPEPLWDLQETHFRALVKIAMDADKPIIIHTRRAERRTFEVLRELGAERVNWHCYSSKVKLAEQIAAHGHYLSIPANARKSQNSTRLLQRLPRSQILFETDCPYLGPRRDELNEPANVAGTVAYAAELWSCDASDVVSQAEENFERLFRFRP